MRKYFCESDMPRQQIQAALAAGEIELWRHDGENQWFRATDGSNSGGVIRGVPAEAMSGIDIDSGRQDTDEDFDQVPDQTDEKGIEPDSIPFFEPCEKSAAEILAAARARLKENFARRLFRKADYIQDEDDDALVD